LAQGVWGRVWDGKTDSEWYWENPEKTEFTITTSAQFAGFAQLVNGGNNFSGKTIKLGANIMLNDTTDWRRWGTDKKSDSRGWGSTTEMVKPTNAWTPIGSYTNEDSRRPFSGTFDGGGNAISGVYINNKNDYQGLFGYVVSSAAIKNIGVTASYVEGKNYVGGLVGLNGGTITNSYATGNVIGSSSSLSAIFVGGLIGWNNGVITDCYTTGNIKGSYGVFTSYVGGGLVGRNEGGTITNCYATGNVDGSGLVNWNSGTITNSYATGNVNGGSGLVEINEGGTITNCYATGNMNGKGSRGGLVGSNYGGIITNSYATGNVSGYDTFNGVGGLVASNDGGTIINCYATGNVNGGSGLVGSNSNRDSDDGKIIKGIIENSYAIGNVNGEYAGGLVGYNEGTVTNCYATGNVKGRKDAGGLVISNSGTITNCYAMGNVAGETTGGFVGNNYNVIENSYAMGEVTGSTAGGLVGKSDGHDRDYDSDGIKGTIKNSYAIGNVKGTGSTVGGLVGVNGFSTIVNSYYDRQTSGQSDINKGEPKSTAQMKQQAIFQGWDFDGIWGIDENKNNGYPYLQSSEKSLPVKYKYPQKVQYGTLTDSRDGKKYKAVKIGEQVWMAENLNYNANGSKCYDNKPAYCAKYGRLYDWKMAMKACPNGWHLPTSREWGELDGYADMHANNEASKYLRATSGWSNFYRDNNGTDDFGFSALPGGYGKSDGYFSLVGSSGYWWGSSEYDSNYAYYQGIDKNEYWKNYDKSHFLSVRCVKD